MIPPRFCRSKKELAEQKTKETAAFLFKYILFQLAKYAFFDCA